MITYLITGAVIGILGFIVGLISYTIIEICITHHGDIVQ